YLRRRRRAINPKGYAQIICVGGRRWPSQLSFPNCLGTLTRLVRSCICRVSDPLIQSVELNMLDGYIEAGFRCVAAPGERIRFAYLIQVPSKGVWLERNGLEHREKCGVCQKLPEYSNGPHPPTKEVQVLRIGAAFAECRQLSSLEPESVQSVVRSSS